MSDAKALGTPRVRMESPDALFCPDHHIETPVPAPLYLLSCLRLPLETGYAMKADGTVENPGHAFQRNEIIYPDGSRFFAEVSGSPSLGLPNVYDLDYLLGLIRVADQEGIEPDGRLSDISYSRIIRATRLDAPVTNPKIVGTKRALARWANTTVRTALEMTFDDEAERLARGTQRPLGSRSLDARPRRREREATHWVLEYDWETEQVGRTSRDTIGLLRLNPIWRTQTDLGLAAWLDVEIHNALHSALAKAMYLRLVIAAAQGHLQTITRLPMQRWIEVLGVESKDRAAKIAGRFGEALQALQALGVVSATEVANPKRGYYEIAIQPGEPITHLLTTRGIGSMDPVRTRTLIWHLGQLGFSPAEARNLLGRHGLQVQMILQRVHYERTVRGGKDRTGKPVTRWVGWIGKGLSDNWSFDEPEYLRWLASQSARFADAPTVSSAPRARALPAPAAATPARAEQEPAAEGPAEFELPDNVWGRAVALLGSVAGTPKARIWFRDTWLTDVEEAIVRVGTTNSFAGDWIQDKHGATLQEHLSVLLGRPVRLVITLESARPPVP